MDRNSEIREKRVRSSVLIRFSEVTLKTWEEKLQ